MSEHHCGLRPLWDQVVIELPARRETKLGSLHIPQTEANESKPRQGTIVAMGSGEVVAGSGKENIDMTLLKLGSQVLFRPYAATEFERDGKKYAVLRAGDIMCEVIE
jgi:co-chaperonin GroES (HSP10)